MKDLGHSKQILVMKITRLKDEKKIYLSQKYIECVLERFNMKNDKHISTTSFWSYEVEQEDVSYN